MRLPTPARTKTHRARELRQDQTEAEEKAWKFLRNRGILGLKFRRQKVVHGFIVDFYCADPPLVVELDGGIHNSPDVAATDAEKDEALERHGIRVIRIRNEDVTHDRLEAEIKAAVT